MVYVVWHELYVVGKVVRRFSYVQGRTERSKHFVNRESEMGHGIVCSLITEGGKQTSEGLLIESALMKSKPQFTLPASQVHAVVDIAFERQKWRGSRDAVAK